ncbi:hypothetical protein BJV78DRAFT_1289634 [Lactifluus subvellereus]|nr:hypothetical protein BJV78DRAFT_1289634 [Lactifluus subvellereus]
MPPTLIIGLSQLPGNGISGSSEQRVNVRSIAQQAHHARERAERAQIHSNTLSVPGMPPTPVPTAQVSSSAQSSQQQCTRSQVQTEHQAHEAAQQATRGAPPTPAPTAQPSSAGSSHGNQRCTRSQAQIERRAHEAAQQATHLSHTPHPSTPNGSGHVQLGLLTPPPGQVQTEHQAHEAAQQATPHLLDQPTVINDTHDLRHRLSAGHTKQLSKQPICPAHLIHPPQMGLGMSNQDLQHHHLVRRHKVEQLLAYNLQGPEGEQLLPPSWLPVDLTLNLLHIMTWVQ